MTRDSRDARVNDRNYWNQRFASGDWASKGGFSQTQAFALAQVARFGLPPSFSGSLCDFGCGAGDAMPIYRAAFPAARLVGVDFSPQAIKLGASRFANIAEFVCGTANDTPPSDVIVCSNVLEHLEDDVGTVQVLVSRCLTLLIAVPYRESPLSSEHVRAYDLDAFAQFKRTAVVPFKSKGWTQYGYDLVVNTYLKNVVRLVLGRPLVRRRMQLLIRIEGTCGRHG